MRRFLLAPVAALLASLTVPPVLAAEEGPALAKQAWSWIGVTGQYDRAQLKRGFQVYHDVCSNCHSLKLIAYRNLSAIGLSGDEIKTIAAEKQVTDGPNDQGDMFQRPAKASDHFVPPFPNDQAARASNNGALPPDLSLIVKGRKGGPDYIYAILTGFKDAPADFKMNDGMNYNTAFAGNQIAMPPPLSDGVVTYADGTPNTKEQEAKDIVAFLNWASEPELELRHALGIKVLAFLVILTGVFYVLKRKVWANVH